MKHKFFALFIAFVFILNSFGSAFADTKSNKNQLLALLPASDMIAAVDAKRFFATSLPQILSGNKEMLDEINGKIDEFKTNTGIDMRQFEQIAVGVSAKQISETQTEYEPVVLARGSYSADSLITLAKFASGDKYREEKIGGKSVYIFSPKELIEKNRTAVKNSTVQKAIDFILPKLSGETAVTAYDKNTLAFGKLERVRLLLTDSKSRVDANLLAKVSINPTAVANFAANLPKGLSEFMELSDDDIGQNLSAIRQIYGTFDVAGENASVSISAKTVKPENAESLKALFVSLQVSLADFLVNSKRESQKVYGRMLKNAKFTRVGDEVKIDLQVPQTDINILVGAK
jgi:hypothetical protein